MRRLSFALAVIVFIQALTFTAFASVGDDEGWSVWNIIDAIGGFFGGIIDAIGGFVESVIDAIGGFIKLLLDGLKYLFIPNEGYFSRMFEKLRDKLWGKFGGLLAMGDYVRGRLSSLKPYAGTDKELILRFPQGHLLNGQSINLLQDAAGLLSLIRSVFTGMLVITTFAFCYRRLIAMIGE